MGGSEVTLTEELVETVTDEREIVSNTIHHSPETVDTALDNLYIETVHPPTPHGEVLTICPCFMTSLTRSSSREARNDSLGCSRSGTT